MLAYATASKTSFDNVEHRWIQELRHHCPETPVVIVGLKSDLKPKVTTKEGKAMASKLGCAFAECSSLNGNGVQQVMDLALRSAVREAETRFKQKRGPAAFIPNFGGFSFDRFSTDKLRAFFGKVKPELPEPPVMPEAGKAPQINIILPDTAGDFSKQIIVLKFKP